MFISGQLFGLRRQINIDMSYMVDLNSFQMHHFYFFIWWVSELSLKWSILLFRYCIILHNSLQCLKAEFNWW